VCAPFALTVKLTGQARVPSAPIPLPTSEPQKIMGEVTVKASADGKERIQFWVNTPTYLAKEVILEAEKFTLSRAADGSQIIESAGGTVRLTGFTLAHGIQRTQDTVQNRTMLQNAEGNILTWDRSFTLRILADGTPEWFCCPSSHSRPGGQ
jgi:uncharacterized protein (DUF1778 family)